MVNEIHLRLTSNIFAPRFGSPPPHEPLTRKSLTPTPSRFRRLLRVSKPFPGRLCAARRDGIKKSDTDDPSSQPPPVRGIFFFSSIHPVPSREQHPLDPPIPSEHIPCSSHNPFPNICRMPFWPRAKNRSIVFVPLTLSANSSGKS